MEPQSPVPPLPAVADLPWQDLRAAAAAAPGTGARSWPRPDADHLLVSSAQMAALEEQLFASGLPVEALMEKAALGVVARLRQGAVWSRLQQRGALVLVGPGHNGGDGLVVARELHLAGIGVRLWSPFERRRPLTEAHWRHARWLGISALEAPPDPTEPALWIDALFGIGQHRPLEGSLGELLAQRHSRQPGQLIAVDVPSGLCADSGRPLGEQAACAALTCCIGLLKQGLVQDSALAWVGELSRIDLGLPAALLDTLPPEQPRRLSAADAAGAPWPPLPAAAPKYGRGRVLVVAGSDAYRGAALLCLAGASASGCGSLRAAVPEALAAQLWRPLPHAVVSGALASDPMGGLDLGSLPAEALERLDAVVLGPGIGAGDGPLQARAQSLWARLQALEGLLLLDADGLNRLAGDGAAAATTWLQGRAGPTWLTPHGGEFRRLFPDLAELEPLEAAGAAARRCGAGVLLKGARSVIAAADGRRWQLSSAEAAAARAGLGDVLAGYAAGRAAAALAAGSPRDLDGALLAAAALEHALAGQRAAERHGSGGATPLAVAEALAAATPAAMQGPLPLHADTLL